jgi:hypothetical protein
VSQAVPGGLRRTLRAALSFASPCLAVLSAALLSPVVAHAETSDWLAWNAPAECQNTAEVERRLESLLGQAAHVGSLPPTRVRMGWSPERGWMVRVTVQLPAGQRERALDAPSCADAFDVIALSLALLLDPSFEEPEPAAPEPEPTPVEVHGGIDASAALDEPSPPPVARSPVVDAAPPGRDAPSPGRRLTLQLGGGALTDLGVYPVPQFGAAIQVGLSHRSLRAELEGGALASESTRFAGAEYPVNFHTVMGALRGCYVPQLTERLFWAVCAGGELGMLGAREQGGVSRRSDGLWLAAEVATGPEFTAAPGLRAFARVRGVIPMIRHEFFLAGGEPVHSLPWISPQLEVGVNVDVTDIELGGH